jgi:hypothetical protein
MSAVGTGSPLRDSAIAVSALGGGEERAIVPGNRASVPTAVPQQARDRSEPLCHETSRGWAGILHGAQAQTAQHLGAPRKSSPHRVIM